MADPEEPVDAEGLSYTQSVTDFQRYLAAPPQMPLTGMAGEALFTSTGCAVCHTPAFTTRNDAELEAALRGIAIRPFSDWLLHDMGAAADGIADGTADVRDMRTPPLWGISDTPPYMHDGRAEDLLEAILAHDGEAAGVTMLFQQRSTADRESLILFLEDL